MIGHSWLSLLQVLGGETSGMSANDSFQLLLYLKPFCR
jgi:hypothetical protein